MGGFGSNRWPVGYQRKIAVEECWTLRSSRLYHTSRHFQLGRVGTVRAVRQDDGKCLSVRFAVLPPSVDGPRVALAHGRDEPEQVKFAAVPLSYGVRYYFRCPSCGRHCGKLYLPDGARWWACRTCHDLTYHSRIGNPVERIMRWIVRWADERG